MIGNDIVDLAKAKLESNWQRVGYLNKIFTKNEQTLIDSSANPEIMVWNLWSRKEAAYKIYNRHSNYRGYFPLQLECNYLNEISGTVSCRGEVYYTQTEITADYVYTVAVASKNYFSKIFSIDKTIEIFKNNGIPFIKDNVNKREKPVSITHHGQFYRAITL